MTTMNEDRARVVDAMCMTWRHDFGLDRKDDELGSCGMTDTERDALRRQMGQLYDHHFAAWQRAQGAVPDAQAAPVGEREAFEAWFNREAWKDGCYGNPDILMRQLWPCWQARAALSAAPAHPAERQEQKGPDWKRRSEQGWQAAVMYRAENQELKARLEAALLDGDKLARLLREAAQIIDKLTGDPVAAGEMLGDIDAVLAASTGQEVEK